MGLGPWLAREQASEGHWPEKGAQCLSQGSGVMLIRPGHFPEDHWLLGGEQEF